MTNLLGKKEPIEIVEDILRNRFMDNLDNNTEDDYILVDDEDNDVFVAFWNMRNRLVVDICECYD